MQATMKSSSLLLFCGLLSSQQSLIVVTSYEIESDELPHYWYIPGGSQETYSIPGDINIGALVSISWWNWRTGTCFPPRHIRWNKVMNVEDIAFAVDYVNRDPNLLPNIRLGFVIRDVCRNPLTAQAAALSFLPRSEKICNETMCNVQQKHSPSTDYKSEDVIGVISPPNTDLVIPVSSLLGAAHVPIIGSTTTNDELSDKYIHPYYFRVIPPDIYTVQAVLKFISSNGWSYISVLYDRGSYGENSFDRIKQIIGKYNICIATSHRLEWRKIESVVNHLLDHHRARVVVMFCSDRMFRRVLISLAQKNATDHFVFIGTQGVALYSGTRGRWKIDPDPGIGAFTFDLYSEYVPEFYNYLRQQTFATTKNPWLRINRTWENFFRCSFADDTCDVNKNLMESLTALPHDRASLRADSVLALAHATHNLLQERCPNVTRSEAKKCITGELLRQYLKKVSFDGFTNQVEFNEHQDLEGKYMIGQFVYDYFPYPFAVNETLMNEKKIFKKMIGIYDAKLDEIFYFNNSISWSHLKKLKRIVPISEDSNLHPDVPESVCSGPCKSNEYKMFKGHSCCWECRTCRSNEIIIDGGNTSCAKCPDFNWPDPLSNFRKCLVITPTYPKMTEPLPIILICLSIVIIIIVIVIFVGYVVYRNNRVVKAGSRELSMMQLIAILVGYLTVIAFQLKPTDVSCAAVFFMFCMSFSWLYAPLLVKSVRIFRIFRSGTKHNRRPKYVSPHSQVIMSAFLISVQVLLYSVSYNTTRPKPVLSQQVKTEKYVELSCDLTMVGLSSFLVYNLLLVSLCSFLAFKTRKLPNNFNETKFISMCVSTTLVIWMAFIPTYFTSDRQNVRVMLLSMALILNHSVAVLFLFVPKLYAAAFLPTEAGNFVTTTRFQQNTNVFPTTISSRISPDSKA